jgi:hypothetical protein
MNGMKYKALKYVHIVGVAENVLFPTTMIR